VRLRIFLFAFKIPNTYCKEIRKLKDKFHGLKPVHIARRYNKAADELAKIASTRGTVPPNAFSRDLLEPSIDLSIAASIKASSSEPINTVEALLAAAEVMEIKQPSRHPSRTFDWRMPFLDSLIQGELLEDRAEAYHIARRAKSYVIYDESNELHR
jgi:hypothetical protein